MRLDIFSLNGIMSGEKLTVTAMQRLTKRTKTNDRESLDYSFFLRLDSKDVLFAGR